MFIFLMVSVFFMTIVSSICNVYLFIDKGDNEDEYKFRYYKSGIDLEYEQYNLLLIFVFIPGIIIFIFYILRILVVRGQN